MLLFQSKQFLHTVIKIVHSDQALLPFLVYDYLTLCNALEKIDQPILRSGVANGQTKPYCRTIALARMPKNFKVVLATLGICGKHYFSA